MKPRDELVDRARALAQTVAESALSAPVHVEITTSADDWHNTLFRQVFEQNMTIWKAFTLLDVILDGESRPVGFVDHDAYRRADDTTPLTDEELRGLVMDDELLPAHARIVGSEVYPGPEGGRLVAVTVEGRGRQGPRRWIVEINAARKLVAAVRPLDGD